MLSAADQMTAASINKETETSHATVPADKTDKNAPSVEDAKSPEDKADEEKADKEAQESKSKAAVKTDEKNNAKN